jgi:biotin carboxyl carrier protein
MTAPGERATGATVEEVRAEMVAAVLQVDVAVGDDVTAGTTLLLLESMKMEIPVLCETGGRVRRIDVVPGDVVQEGDLLAVVG